MFVNSHNNGVLSPIFSQVSTSPSPSAFPLLKVPITPVLKNLHWLPIKSRITFKILLLTYKILNGQSPSYLTSLISSYKPVRSLRSSDHLLLRVPNVMTATYGQRTFSYCAPKLWNSLPKSLKESETVTIFKKKLKTFLFGDYFNL